MQRRNSYCTLNRKNSLSYGLKCAYLGMQSGASTVFDSHLDSGHRDMSSATPATDWIQSQIGRYCLDFNDNDNTFYSNVALNSDITRTLACWFYRIGSTGYAFETGSGPINRRPFKMALYADGISWVVGAGLYTLSLPMPTHEWHHIGLVYTSSPSLYTFYHDGVVVGSYATSWQWVGYAGDWAIRGGSTYGSHCRVADICAWLRALSPVEMQALADPSDLYMRGWLQPRSTSKSFKVPSTGGRRRRLLLAS